MDEVLQQFSGTGIDGDMYKTNFNTLYKTWGNLRHQEQRRRNLLDVQKTNRNNNVDTSRGILDLVSAVEEHNANSRKATYRPSIYVAGFTRTSASYKDVLMMSEWLIEKPEDFHENWYVVPCPKGIRTLVVAFQGNTKFYTKYGSFKMSCATALPGGNTYDPHYKNQCVVLDCFHVESINTVYILDLLAWNSQPMTNGETEFRHYWMRTHIEEIPDLKTINAKNKIKFDILPKVDCNLESFNNFMMTLPHFNNFVPALDGLLFYHKMANYVSGVTPLVGWLYPYMVNEILGPEITVNQGYAMERPINYVNQARFIQKFECKSEKRVPKYMQGNAAMDTSPEEVQCRHHKKGRPRHRKRSTKVDVDEEMDTSLLSNINLFTKKMPTIKPRFTMIRPEAEPTWNG